jgi:DNA polymerase-1
MNMTKKLFLLDAYALIYRAHYAFVKRPLLNSKGQNVSAITGFMNTVLDVLEKQQPSHLAVAFDLPSPTFRHIQYPEYKANREEQPEDITWSVPYIQQILEGMGIPVVSAEGFEADDVIGTLAKQAEKEDFEVFMMTSDKDYSQLVSPKIHLYKPARMGNDVETWTEAKVLQEWGIRRVDQVVDMLGLQGDAVDNIPGVKGIGPKTAQQLLDQYDTIENLLEHLGELKERTRDLLEAGRENALLSKALAKIDINVPVMFHAENYACTPFASEAVLGIFKELEFRSLTERVLRYQRSLAGGTPEPSTKPKTSKTKATEDQPQQFDLFGNALEEDKPKRLAQKNIHNTEHDYRLLSAEELPWLAAQLEAQPIFCFDTETTGLNLAEAQAVGISFCWEAGKAYYLPLSARREEAMKELGLLRTAMENPKIAKIGQNLKFDMLLLRHYGLQVKGILWDTMLMHYVLEPEHRHGMDYLSEVYLDYSPVPIEELLKGRRSMRDVPLEQIKEYAAEDADVTWQLYQQLRPLLQKEQLSLYEEIEARLVPVLVEMEYWGVRVDVAFLKDYAAVLRAELEEMQEKIYTQAGKRNFNLDSPKQVGEVLFEHLKLPYQGKKTKTGQYATNEERLEELAAEHQIVRDLLEYRQLAKLLSTYVEALPQMISPRTGRVHTSYNQALTSTGRLSSQNPNLQNIPIRTERGREIRKAFVPQEQGWWLLAADYSQIELRLMAEMSGDENMLKAFQDGLDIHQATAARIFGVPLEEVSKAQRYSAKTVNFSIIYGAGATNIAKNLGIKRVEASQLIEQYFKQYPGIKTYMEEAVNVARNLGYASTLKGRRRYLRDLNSRNGMMRSHAERSAVNTPIQGTAADMIKLAMIGIHEQLQALGLSTRLILQVHDELVFEVPEAELEQVKALVQKAMCEALPGLKVPIEVGLDVGQNWLEAH